MLSLALFLTGFIMAPTIERAYDEGLKPLMAQQIDETAAFPKIVGPFQDFMLKNVREHDLELFVNLSKTGPYATPKDIPLHILAPSFIISELRRGFEIGFLLFIPFIIIDMVVASILMAMGMMMLPPVTISMPFKIIFFVLVDGWYLICGSFGTKLRLKLNIGLLTYKMLCIVLTPMLGRQLMKFNGTLFEDITRVASGAASALSGIREQIEARHGSPFGRSSPVSDQISRDEFEAVAAMGRESARDAGSPASTHRCP